ncbi:acetyltransferase [Escherichia coli]|nr:acetyltransferase [Escherichia coli]EFO2608233.1 acetyltransferase [Escherichia coli]EFO3874814.1 acetyltransferase [Escherichia coli]RJJ98742.1 acetyltransferase [Escherichia coli]
MCFFSIKLPSSTIICQPDTPQALTCFHALGNLRNQHDFFVAERSIRYRPEQ